MPYFVLAIEYTVYNMNYLVEKLLYFDWNITEISSSEFTLWHSSLGSNSGLEKNKRRAINSETKTD